MKRVVAFAVAMLWALTFSAFAANDVVRVGVEANLKPFVYMDTDGKVKGFDVDIAQAACKDMGKRCEFVNMEWDGLIPALQVGKIDAIISSMTITDKRKKVVDFTRAYYKSPSFLTVHNTVISDAQLKGKRIGVMRGSIDAQYAAEVLAPRTGLVPVVYANQNEIFMEIINGRLDGALTPQLEAEAGFFDMVDNPLATGQFHFYGNDGQGFLDEGYYGYGIGMAVSKKNPELLAGLNKAINDIRADGRYHEINNRYFPRDIWGQ
jgi:arginine/ornithine transport system substrate-binding protein